MRVHRGKRPSMSETYAAMIDAWREAAEATREVQTRLTQQFDDHLAGRAPAPSEKDIARLRQLRDMENRKLEAAIQYAARAAHEPPTGLGGLSDD